MTDVCEFEWHLTRKGSRQANHLWTFRKNFEQSTYLVCSTYICSMTNGCFLPPSAWWWMVKYGKMKFLFYAFDWCSLNIFNACCQLIGCESIVLSVRCEEIHCDCHAYNVVYATVVAFLASIYGLGIVWLFFMLLFFMYMYRRLWGPFNKNSLFWVTMVFMSKLLAVKTVAENPWPFFNQCEFACFMHKEQRNVSNESKLVMPLMAAMVVVPDVIVCTWVCVRWLCFMCI